MASGASSSFRGRFPLLSRRIILPSFPPPPFFPSDAIISQIGSSAYTSRAPSRMPPGHAGRSFYQQMESEEAGDDDLEEHLHQPEKKRRLRTDQVQSLERSFETENKLEPERKLQLARELGLQPRQVAIWFQNRRARWKTKQLEKDYEVLQSSYSALRADYEAMAKEKEKLRSEIRRGRRRGSSATTRSSPASRRTSAPPIAACSTATAPPTATGDGAPPPSSHLLLHRRPRPRQLRPLPAAEDDAEVARRLPNFGFAADHSFWLWPSY
ncbi:unnamed protein product [Spirodela intermedia]|uniref:Homeobox-leucine zipper protein n=1 Tax=Spirodela intermedia TaxID=51605 RepID=A0A7I8ISC1_SPIIN|nr:unnamed protein product [Spirodela intermedia]CAA6660877.1 unnamed protein product [Spirodela intermedia]